MNMSARTPVDFEALESAISSDNPQVAFEARLRLHEVANQVNYFTDIAKESPQTVSDTIIQIIESRVVLPDVLPQLEEENFHIDSSRWEERVDDDGTRYKINPKGDVTELLDGPFKGQQHFGDKAIARELLLANKRAPNNEEWEIIIASAKKRAEKESISVAEVLGIQLAGIQYGGSG